MHIKVEGWLSEQGLNKALDALEITEPTTSRECSKRKNFTKIEHKNLPRDAKSRLERLGFTVI